MVSHGKRVDFMVSVLDFTIWRDLARDLAKITVLYSFAKHYSLGSPRSMNGYRLSVNNLPKY